MNRFMVSGLLIGLLVGSARAQPNQPRLRIFFDNAGAGEKEPRSKDLSFENPSVAADIGQSVRFYLYVEFGNPEENWGFSLNIAAEGDGEIASWLIYNTFGDGPRWDGFKQASGGPTRFIKNLGGVGFGTNPGLTNEKEKVGVDFHHRNDTPFGTTLLGYLDLRRTGAGDLEMFLEVGKGKLAPMRNGTADDMFAFGFGDDPVPNKRNARSTGWDARVVAACDPCDANCDGSIDLTDVEPFIALLLGREPCDACTGDTNNDGSIDLKDVEPFIKCLLG